jgi:ribonuclease Z
MGSPCDRHKNGVEADGMRPIFQPRLVNAPFGDPGLYVDVLFERRALLFDLGDITVLPPRKILRTSHVFVTHTHMDHFVGFDRLLRVCLGRARPLALYGPDGFIEQVHHKLAAFTWNLVENYAIDLVITAFEVAADGTLRRAEFNSRERFARRDAGDLRLRDGVVLDEPAFQVRCVVLDHQVPCLGFALQEAMHVNVWRNRLAELGLAPGAWLQGVKRAVLAGAPDDTLVVAEGCAGDPSQQTTVSLGTLRAWALRCVPGQKIAYVSDVAFHEDNVRRIVELASQADLLFMEAMFLERDGADARRKSHLTAHQAGEIARRAGARALVPFHFSPRYSDCASSLRSEAEIAFGGLVA